MELFSNSLLKLVKQMQNWLKESKFLELYKISIFFIKKEDSNLEHHLFLFLRSINFSHLFRRANYSPECKVFKQGKKIPFFYRNFIDVFDTSQFFILIPNRNSKLFFLTVRIHINFSKFSFQETFFFHSIERKNVVRISIVTDFNKYINDDRNELNKNPNVVHYKI